MSQPNPDKPAPVLSKAATGAALAMLAFYVLLEIYLFQEASGAKELLWTRYTFLTKGIEAIVFAAAGALFGTKVERAQTQAAEDTAKKAKDTLDRERAEHADAIRQSNVLKALLDLIDTDVAALSANQPPPPTQQRRRGQQPPPATEQIRSRPPAEIAQDMDGDAAASALLRLQSFAQRMLNES